jgi:coenzyme F420-0:L-glutamate ligase / coenzyme F420-1:gamma-L-glutamate ligase
MTGASGASIVLRAPAGIGEVRPADDLVELVIAASAREGWSWRDGDVVVVAQKIVSKAEGRFASLDAVKVTDQARELSRRTGKDPSLVALILAESVEVLRAARDVLIVRNRHGVVLANAGIDRSNVPQDTPGERVLLLPADPDASARRLKSGIDARCGVAVGVIVNDSLGRAWRNGTVGIALGVAGLPALQDARGQRDREGRPLQITRVGLADEIAAAASMLMGQGAEGRPLVLMRGLQYAHRGGVAAELVRPLAEDLFR